MIKSEKQKKAIKAVQDLIIYGRKLAYEGVASKYLAEFLDNVEYLPALILEDNDRTELFERHLIGTCETYNCSYIVTWYNKK